MSERQRVLVLFAHPAQRRSEVNVAMARAARGVEGVTVADLYAEYPRLEIDIEAEQARLRAHDVLVMQFPMYWYSTPAILKEWQDLVLEHGFAYGTGGTALHGKGMLAALTTGGPATAYRAGGYNNFTVDELLAPLEQTANLCGMRWLPPFVLHGARRALEDGRIPDHVADYVALLAALRDGQDVAAGRIAGG